MTEQSWICFIMIGCYAKKMSTPISTRACTISHGWLCHYQTCVYHVVTLLDKVLYYILGYLQHKKSGTKIGNGCALESSVASSPQSSIFTPILLIMLPIYCILFFNFFSPLKMMRREKSWARFFSFLLWQGVFLVVVDVKGRWGRGWGCCLKSGAEATSSFSGPETPKLLVSFASLRSQSFPFLQDMPILRCCYVLVSLEKENQDNSNDTE